MAGNRGGDWLRYENPDEKLPWLEPADDYYDRPSPLRGKLIGGLVGLVAVIALLVAGMTWYLGRDTAPPSGEAGLIKAPGEPYKISPSEPGGMIVEGQGDTVYAAGAGSDPGGTIDLSALPEEPISRTAPGTEAGDAAVVVPPARTSTNATPAKPATAAKPPASPASTTASLPAAKPAAKPIEAAPAGTGNGSFGVQLGAFSSRAKAESAWKALSGRFAFIGALDKAIEPVGTGDATLYRLRAVGIGSRASATNLCGRLKVAGDGCTVVAP